MNNKTRALFNLSNKIEKILYAEGYTTFKKEIKYEYKLAIKGFDFLDHNIIEPITEITVKENWNFEIFFNKENNTFEIILWK